MISRGGRLSEEGSASHITSYFWNKQKKIRVFTALELTYSFENRLQV